MPAPYRDWTASDVAEAIRDAFRNLRHTSVWATGNNALLRAGLGPEPSSTFDIVAFSGTVLGHGSSEHRALLLWARRTANTGEDLASLNECCVAMGWNASTFRRRRARACEKIARAKNNADRPKYEEYLKKSLDSARGGAGPSLSGGVQTAC
jgi:hypothetical protein